jgi:hypothetical protein
VIDRTVKFVLWTAVVVAPLMFLLFMTQLGDCPEKIIDPPFENACSMQKLFWGWGLLIAAAAAWMIGDYFILRRRDRV